MHATPSTRQPFESIQIDRDPGTSEEVRTYIKDGQRVARRAFHSGKKCLRKAEIEALGYTEEKLPGKERFVRPITKRARRLLCG